MKKWDFKISEVRLLNKTFDIMKWCFMVLFFYSIYSYYTDSKLIYLVVGFVAVRFSYKYYRMKLDYDKFLVDRYIRTWENNPFSKFGRNIRRKAARYIKKNPIKID